MTFNDAPITDPAPASDPAPEAAAPTLSPEEAAEARIEAFFRDDEAGTDDDLDEIDGEAGSDPDPDEMPYRDAKRLREELKADRERWRPYEDTFGKLHETDREVMRDTLALLATDPAAAADRFAKFADAIRAKTGVGPAQDAGASGEPGPAETADGDRPLTRAEVERLFAEREEAALVEQQRSVILAEVRELGYDPDADVNTDAWIDFKMLVDVAATLDGDFAKAHERIQSRFQKEIDSFVEARRADAGRPVMTGAQGSGPALPQREINTTADAEAAMNVRLDAQFGPARTRR